MPQRTNEFQELVSLIRHSLAKDGDTIEDSAMVKVQGLETEREIDILHKTADGFSTIKIAVEAKDERRKLDLTTIEQICAKYRGEGRVCVDKFMIVSRNGFTEGAIDRAKLLDVPLLTLDEAKDLDWTTVGPEHTALQRPQVLNFKMAPHFDAIRVVPPLPTGLERAIIQQGRVRCPKCPANRDHGSLIEYVTNATLNRKDAEGQGWLQQLKDESEKNPDGRCLNIGLKPPDGLLVHFQGVAYPMEELHVVIHAVNFSGQMKCTSYRLASSEGSTRLIHHMSAEIGSRRFSLVMPDGMKSKKIAMKIDKKNPRQRAEERKKQRRAEKKRKND